ncbi:hypothetical protein ASPZODRAFT_132009 [Penicilliopsis zonata CBS 506.65]|uniref:RRM domain-containing protein n=1 Tax=Penicilliopsis zonata CBS 506.65 TaxID=1073090 RepID=A0A1L9SJ58_9EURO|nr:hypothetical protein ASPZODRAFT_132009 [Penicilliopsis zonata CBS 506.65]OJJ47074.1 hypothetical protein ASPZODRAFT_132009 [Penicilliopsis zonata CBS 506.65]
MVDAADRPRPEEQTPVKSPFQNGVRTTGRAFNSPNWRVKSDESPSAQSPGSPSVKTNTSRSAFSKTGTQVPQAISEGRRLYVGNMPYTAKADDVQALFTATGYNIERIDIAMDPFTGRNPSYCFVDLESKEEAERAMVELDGKELQGRPLKIKPGVAKTSAERSQQPRTEGSPRGEKSSPLNFDRWQRGERTEPSSPAKALGDQSKRVYVGGLPRLQDQEALQSNMVNFFQGLDVTNVTKLFTPHPSKRFEPGDHYYLFVDFSTAEEAQTALQTFNGQDGPWGGKIRVQRARGETWKPEERARWAASQAAQEPAADEAVASA